MRTRAVAAICALIASAAFAAAETNASLEFLSKHGSDRATAYVESSKIVRFGDQAHVTWLEKIDDGYLVRIRSTNTRTGESSPVYTIGEAQDNHGGPALTVDADGYLHVLYYPHHSPMRYRRSMRPNDASDWTAAEKIGVDLTYPALVCAEDGSLIMVARRSYSDRPWELELWRKPAGESWSRVGAVLQARYGNYAQFAASLAWGSDHATLHLATRIYEKGEWDGQEEPTTTIGYLRSTDFGDTWRKGDGTRVTLPATAETLDVIASSQGGEGGIYVIGSMTVGPDDQPYIPYSVRQEASSKAFLASPSEGREWRHTHLNPSLPNGYDDWDVLMFGGASFGASGKLVVVANAMPLEPEDLGWADPELEVAVFSSSDGGKTFTSSFADDPDLTKPRWLPNIERATGFNKVPETPSFIYTEGASAESANPVFWWKGE